ncbi:hypothetical protein BpHYR1_017669 [Brachionus plicatilis]|uniref:Uncharacterized protein n=1 Tax=Brachionus plicatilis TaxID=10195 RepID=A0A3M7SQ84_BRAPC|nr:hypothetical protein BpHYR1_017669 [Brachionus plicatilis]
MSSHNNYLERLTNSTKLINYGWLTMDPSLKVMSIDFFKKKFEVKSQFFLFTNFISQAFSNLKLNSLIVLFIYLCICAELMLL